MHTGLDNTFELMQTLVANGADVIELGVAFSDPMADGRLYLCHQSYRMFEFFNHIVKNTT
jgi:hypothetical protein